MQRLLLVLLITTGAISLSGCGFFNRQDVNDIVEDVTIENPSPGQTDQSEETANGDLPTIPNGEESTIVVEGVENSPTVLARDLIQSTDPNERTIGVERTRNDPFAELTIPLIPPEPIEVPEDPQAGGNRNTQRPTTTAAPRPTTTASGPSQTSPTRNASAGNSGARNASSGSNNASNVQERPAVTIREVESSIPEIAALPEIPQPTNARAVRVSGVIQVGGGAPYAIVQAPNEIERYVRQGERIAGGRVVVKRIDTGSLEPRVVLVENGIEVERFVTGSDEVVEEEIEPPAAETVSTIGSLPVLPSPGI